MKLSNLRADYVSLILCFTAALLTVIAIYFYPSKSNVTEPHIVKVINGVYVCTDKHCQDSPYCDEACIGTDYHLEVCLNDTL